MPTNEELLVASKGKLGRLKELGEGLRVARVLGDRVLVKVITPRTEIDAAEQRGLIVVPESVKSAYVPLPTTGIVLAVGEEVRRWPMRLWDKIRTMFGTEGLPILSPGDMILFARLSGLDFQISHEDLRIIQTKEVLAVLADTDGSVVEVKK